MSHSITGSMNKEKNNIPPSTFPFNVIHNRANFIHRQSPKINGTYNLLENRPGTFLANAKVTGPSLGTNNTTQSPNCWFTWNSRIYINTKPTILRFTPFNQIKDNPLMHQLLLLLPILTIIEKSISFINKITITKRDLLTHSLF